MWLLLQNVASEDAGTAVSPQNTTNNRRMTTASSQGTLDRSNVSQSTVSEAIDLLSPNPASDIVSSACCVAGCCGIVDSGPLPNSSVPRKVNFTNCTTLQVEKQVTTA